jgi:hypothetical protein
MSLVKNFDEFIFEGSYDKLTGEISSAVMKKIKETNNGEEYFEGVKTIYGPQDSVPDFNEMIEGDQFIKIDHFVDSVSGVDVIVNLTVVRDEAPEYTGEFILDGETDDQNSIIYLYLYLTPGSEPKVYSEIAFDLRNLIRHEIEHLTQRGWGEKEGKKMRRNEAIRSKIRSNPELYYRYYKLKDEVPANLQGIYSEAKSRKVPFKDMVNTYLDKKVQQGIIPPIEKMRIYRLWKAAAEKIGGLPSL